jgi:hypothetical protein
MGAVSIAVKNATLAHMVATNTAAKSVVQVNVPTVASSTRVLSVVLGGVRMDCREARVKNAIPVNMGV